MKTTAKVGYGPYTFEMELPAFEHPKAGGKMFVSAEDLHMLENAAARWIIDHGIKAPETIRALRAAAGLTGSQLADLLGVDKSHVSRWENGKADPGVALWNTVASLALEAMEGSTRTLDRLRATQTEPPAEREIRLAAVG